MIRHDVDPKTRTRLARFEGVLCAESLLAFVDEIGRDPRHHDLDREILDLRRVVDLDIDANGLSAILAANDALPPAACAHRSAVVSNDELVFGMVRVFELRATEGQETRGFRRIDDALSWLGLARDEVPFLEGRSPAHRKAE